MKGKLFKVDGIWRLINSHNSIIGTTDLEYRTEFTKFTKAFGCYKLSNDNCESIDYDLDELEVEIEVEKQCNCICHRIPGTMHMEACCNPGSPVFDLEGCLILKRI